ncbi:MAG TPA: amidohydrolase family protein [Burkholderiaceae bacterium]
MPKPHGKDMILFEHADILDPAAGRLLKDRFVLVDGQTIREVSEQPPAAAGARVIDASGKVLMPGLIDCHVHCLASQVHLGRLANLPNVLAVLRAVPLLRGMLERGFTTVRDAGGADYSLAEATRSGVIEGPRIFPSGRALSQTGGHGDFRERNDVIEPCACTAKIGAISRVVDGVDAVRRAVREEIQKGATQIKIMASGGVASPNDPIHFLGYSEDEIRAAVEEAGNAGTYVMAHAYTGRAIARAVRCGVRTIEHGNLVDADAARAMADHGAIAVPTLATYEALATEGAALGFPPEAVAKIEAVRGDGLRSLEVFARAGVRMAYGSDLLGESQRLQSDEFALRARVLGAAEAIRAATTHAAFLLNMEGRLGTVAAGAIADLLLIDGNPLENIDLLRGQGGSIQLMMKDGRILKDLKQGDSRDPHAS